MELQSFLHLRYLVTLESAQVLPHTHTHAHSNIWVCARVTRRWASSRENSHRFRSCFIPFFFLFKRGGRCRFTLDSGMGLPYLYSSLILNYHFALRQVNRLPAYRKPSERSLGQSGLPGWAHLRYISYYSRHLSRAPHVSQSVYCLLSVHNYRCQQ